MSSAANIGGSWIPSDAFARVKWRGYVSSMAKPPFYSRWKPRFDRALAAVLLIPCLPLIGLLVLLVRWTTHGPGVYRQKRVGKHGSTFTMYKLRSMRVDAETKVPTQGVVSIVELDSTEARRGTNHVAVWSQPDDPRITRFGRFLRNTHLDELPQLFNVLKGEMSLVGPRPERPEFVHVLAAQIPGYLDRLAIAPGVTGLAQLNLPPDSDYESVRRKLVLDVQYIKEAGFFLDARILLCTGLRLLKLPADRLLGLVREVPGIENHVDEESNGQIADQPQESREDSSAPCPLQRSDEAHQTTAKHRRPRPRANVTSKRRKPG